MPFPVDNLKKWFDLNKRTLPWRESRTPYRVWISEVMLQQTQVSTVIAYFNRWMELFPLLSDVARAKEVQVIKAWEGLGYYRRVRNFWHSAQIVETIYQGDILTALDDKALKGVGKYTRDALLAFSFKRKVAPVDGNVLRVLSRFFCIEESISVSATQNMIYEKAQQLLPYERPYIIAEALIELGALVCKKVPQCVQCPLNNSCKAYQKNKASLIPIKSRKSPQVILHRWVPLIIYNSRVLIEKRSVNEIMGGLYEFPYIELSSDSDLDHLEDKKIELENRLQISISIGEPLPIQEHRFTNHKVRLYSNKCTLLKPNHCKMVIYDHMDDLPFSAGHKKIKNVLLESAQVQDINREFSYGKGCFLFTYDNH